MVRGSRILLLKDGGNISKVLADFLVCPLSKQPLRSLSRSLCFCARASLFFFFLVSFSLFHCLTKKDNVGKLPGSFLFIWSFSPSQALRRLPVTDQRINWCILSGESRSHLVSFALFDHYRNYNALTFGRILDANISGGLGFRVIDIIKGHIMSITLIGDDYFTFPFVLSMQLDDENWRMKKENCNAGFLSCYFFSNVSKHFPRIKLEILQGPITFRSMMKPQAFSLPDPITSKGECYITLLRISVMYYTPRILLLPKHLSFENKLLCTKKSQLMLRTSKRQTTSKIVFLTYYIFSLFLFLFIFLFCFEAKLQKLKCDNWKSHYCLKPCFQTLIITIEINLS